MGCESSKPVRKIGLNVKKTINLSKLQIEEVEKLKKEAISNNNEINEIFKGENALIS